MVFDTGALHIALRTGWSVGRIYLARNNAPSPPAPDWFFATSEMGQSRRSRRPRSLPLYPNERTSSEPMARLGRGDLSFHFGAYCISPSPNDQSSRFVSTRLIQISSFRT